MNVEMKQYTEPIFARLAAYSAELAQHPLLTAARDGDVRRSTLLEFAFHQYSDSILWIPMLAQMKATRSLRLRRAIEDNIAHEAGIGSTSHVALAVSLMRSLGIASVDAFPSGTFTRSASLWLSEHASWMAEAVLDVIEIFGPSSIPQIHAGMIDAFTETLEVPDALWSRRCASL